MKHGRHRRAKDTADTENVAPDADAADGTAGPGEAAEVDGWWTPLRQALLPEVDADEGDHPDH